MGGIRVPHLTPDADRAEPTASGNPRAPYFGDGPPDDGQSLQDYLGTLRPEDIIRIKTGLNSLGLWPFSNIDGRIDARLVRRLDAFRTVIGQAPLFVGPEAGRSSEIRNQDFLRAAATLGIISEGVLALNDFGQATRKVAAWYDRNEDQLPSDLGSGLSPGETLGGGEQGASLVRTFDVLFTVNTGGDTAADTTTDTTTDTTSGSPTTAPEPQLPATTDGTGMVSVTTGTGGEPVPDPTPRTAGEDLLGIAGGAQLWKVDDKYWFVVYDVPGTEPPVQMAWGVESFEAMERLTGTTLEPEADRNLTSAEFNGEGALNMGITAEIANTADHPFAALVSNFDRITLTQPWMRDPEVLALTMGALIEGRDLSDAELKSTEWWRTRSNEERAWLELSAGDPETAARAVEDMQSKVADTLRQNGMSDPPDSLVTLLAQKRVTGEWTETTLSTQIQALVDPQSELQVDQEVSQLIEAEALTLDTTQEFEQEVRDLVAQWLGPVHGQWDSEQVTRWAGRLRNDPDAADQLNQMLRRQRLALFPEYDNEMLSYEDIAGPWRGMVQQQWGRVIDETDPFFTQLVRANDASVAQEMLRAEGMERGVRQVVDNATAALGQAFGGGVRRAI